MDWLVEQTLWDRARLEELCDAISGESRQLILAGPPGTSKTWVGMRVAEYLTQGGQLFRIVQFHPSYGYEEFMEGLRPEANDAGVITFRPVQGIVLRMVEKAEGPGPHILLIDEINRANLPKVLGELMYLFEYRDQAVDLRYTPQFKLPESLRFIGTMNTADRSIRSIDTALRRRFDIWECPPDGAILDRFYAQSTMHANDVVDLRQGFEMLNTKLTTELDRHHTIGHAFFLAAHMTHARLSRVWEHKIRPLLEEYFFDAPGQAATYTPESFWTSLAP